MTALKDGRKRSESLARRAAVVRSSIFRCSSAKVEPIQAAFHRQAGVEFPQHRFHLPGPAAGQGSAHGARSGRDVFRQPGRPVLLGECLAGWGGGPRPPCLNPRPPAGIPLSMLMPTMPPPPATECEPLASIVTEAGEDEALVRRAAGTDMTAIRRRECAGRMVHPRHRRTCGAGPRPGTCGGAPRHPSTPLATKRERRPDPDGAERAVRGSFG